MKLSYTNVPLSHGANPKPLSETMWLTRSGWRQVDVPWEKLPRMVKSQYRQISPYTFADGVKISENWSNDYQECIILDIDEGLTIEEAKEKFGRYRYLLYTTKSHRKEKHGVIADRFRIILPAVNIPRGDDYWPMVKEIELAYPFIDKGVNNKTGAFLCHLDCEIIINDGELFDCKPFVDAAARKEERRRTLERDVATARKRPTARRSDFKDDIDTERIKERLTRETVESILRSVGYEVKGHKFKLRNERTPSASISEKCYIKDFGSDWGGDIIQLLMDYQGMTFRDAVDYIEGFLR